jgi:hypothetical protein
MITAIDGSKNHGVRMKVMTVQLTAVSQLKDPLANFQSSTVNFIKEENHWLLTSLFEPIRRIEARAVAVNAGKTNKVAFSHLASTPLNNRQAHVRSQLVHNLALANAVTTAKKNRQASSGHCRRKLNESFEVNTHGYLSPLH